MSPELIDIPTKKDKKEIVHDMIDTKDVFAIEKKTNKELAALKIDTLSHDIKKGIVYELGGSIFSTGGIMTKKQKMIADQIGIGPEEIQKETLLYLLSLLPKNSDYATIQSYKLWSPHSSFVKGLQSYVGVPVDGKLGKSTKLAIQKKLKGYVSFFKLPEYQEVNVPDLKKISLDERIAINTSFVGNYGRDLRRILKLHTLGDNAYCTMYVQFIMSAFAQDAGKYLDIRSLSVPEKGSVGGTRDIYRTISSSTFLKKFIDYEDMNFASQEAMKSRLDKMNKGSFFTLQYANSDYKAKGVTHNIISHGGGKFSHWFGGKARDFTSKDIQYHRDDTGKQTITITKPTTGQKYTFFIVEDKDKFSPSQIYTLKRDAMRSYQEFSYHNDKGMTGMQAVQYYADKYHVLKEYVVSQLYVYGYDLDKYYPVDAIALPLIVKPPLRKVSDYDYDVSTHKVKDTRDYLGHVGEFQSYATELYPDLPKHDFEVLMTIFAQESGQGKERAFAEQVYTGSPDWLRGSVDLVRGGEGRSFGLFQINKEIIASMIVNDPAIKNRLLNALNENDVLSWHKINKDISAEGRTDGRRVVTTDRLLEKLLGNNRFAFACAVELLRVNKKVVQHLVLDHRTQSLNTNDMDLTNMFAYHAGMKRTMTAIVQQNLFLLANKRKQTLQYQGDMEHRYLIDGHVGSQTQQLLRVLGVQTYSKDPLVVSYRDKVYHLDNLSEMHQLCKILDPSYVYQRGLSMDKLSQHQWRSVHLHYAYTLLDIAQKKKIPT